MANGSNGQSKVVDSEVESISVCGFHLLVVIGSTVEMYDLRRLKEPVKMKESSMDYQISCISSFPNCQGITLFLQISSFCSFPNCQGTILIV